MICEGNEIEFPSHKKGLLQPPENQDVGELPKRAFFNGW